MSPVSTERFVFEPAPLAGVWRVQCRARHDSRGFFARGYCAEEFRAVGLVQPIAQINHSRTAEAGTVRGLHFQHAPAAETKIVRCTAGRIFDVAVDLRRGSPTFLRWYGAELSADGGASLLIPPGFGHGFQALEPAAEVLYLVTAAYRPEHEDGLHPLDPALAIGWPLPPCGLSERDAARPFVDTASYPGVRLQAVEAAP